MTLARGRVLRRAELESEPETVVLGARCPGAQSGELPRGRLITRAEQEAHRRASEIIARAEGRAADVAAKSVRALAEQHFMARTEARAVALADLAALGARLTRREATSDEQALDRIVAIARVLAERLIGAELALDEHRVLDLAREVLTDVRGARQVVLEANPEDARVLRQYLSRVVPDEPCDVMADEALCRGDLRLRTEVGVVESHLGERLELLAEKLLEGIRS